MLIPDNARLSELVQVRISQLKRQLKTYYDKYHQRVISKPHQKFEPLLSLHSFFPFPCRHRIPYTF